MSKEFLSTVKMDDLRQSKYNPVDKEVIVWTPVVIGKLFPAHVQKSKVQYKSGDYINKQDYPKTL